MRLGIAVAALSIALSGCVSDRAADGGSDVAATLFEEICLGNAPDLHEATILATTRQLMASGEEAMKTAFAASRLDTAERRSCTLTSPGAPTAEFLAATARFAAKVDGGATQTARATYLVSSPAGTFEVAARMSGGTTAMSIIRQ